MPTPKWKPGQSGNPKGRKPGSQYQKKFAEAVTDAEFRDLVRNVLAAAQSGDMQAAGLILNRMVPALRPAAEPVRIDWPDTSGPLEQARAVLTAVANGVITPGDGKALLDGPAAVVRIQEVTDLIPRIEQLEGKA